MDFHGRYTEVVNGCTRATWEFKVPGIKMVQSTFMIGLANLLWSPVGGGKGRAREWEFKTWVYCDSLSDGKNVGLTGVKDGRFPGIKMYENCVKKVWKWSIIIFRIYPYVYEYQQRWKSIVSHGNDLHAWWISIYLCSWRFHGYMPKTLTRLEHPNDISSHHPNDQPRNPDMMRSSESLGGCFLPFKLGSMPKASTPACKRARSMERTWKWNAETPHKCACIIVKKMDIYYVYIYIYEDIWYIQYTIVLLYTLYLYIVWVLCSLLRYKLRPSPESPKAGSARKSISEMCSLPASHLKPWPSRNSGFTVIYPLKMVIFP